MADYRLHPITWKNVIDYNWLQLQITITPCLSVGNICDFGDFFCPDIFYKKYIKNIN